jgi:hypothetical protein
MARMTELSAVEILTAEVRQLTVGNRQVTLSMFRQLDNVDSDHCEPFGCVHDSQAPAVGGDHGGHLPVVHVVGRSVDTGVLVHAHRFKPKHPAPWGGLPPRQSADELTRYERDLARYRDWAALPLIVLAGLR